MLFRSGGGSRERLLQVSVTGRVKRMGQLIVLAHRAKTLGSLQGFNNDLGQGCPTGDWTSVTQQIQDHDNA